MSDSDGRMVGLDVKIESTVKRGFFDTHLANPVP